MGPRGGGFEERVPPRRLSFPDSALGWAGSWEGIEPTTQKYSVLSSFGGFSLVHGTHHLSRLLLGCLSPSNFKALSISISSSHLTDPQTEAQRSERICLEPVKGWKGM